MQSRLAFLVGAAACVVSACASGVSSVPPLFRDWSRPERADYFMARYAVMSGDVPAAATYYRNAARDEPNDAQLMEEAAFTSLLALETGEAAKLSAGASDAMFAHAPFASLARTASDIAAGRNEAARRRLIDTPRDQIDRDIGRLLALWLVSSRDFNTALSAARLRDNRHILAGEARYIEGLALAARGRRAEALVRFEEGWKMSARPAAGIAAHIRVAALAGDAARAKALVDDYRANIGEDPGIEAAAREIAKPSAAALNFSPKTGAALSLTTLASSALIKATPELATAYLAIALEMDPDQEATRLDLAAMLAPQDRQRAALDLLARIYPGSIWRAQAQVTAAGLQQSLGMDDTARATLAKALEGAPSRGVMVQSADLYRSLRDYATAATLYDRVVESDRAAGGESWTVLYARAEARQQLGRSAEAEADLVRALELEPDRPELLNQLGFLWVDRGGKVNEGLAMIERALARLPNQGYIVDSLGWAYFRMGRYVDAVEQLERAAEISPADAEINDHLGDAYWRAGRPREAEYQWKHVLGLKVGDAMAARVREKLSKGLPVASQAQLTPSRNTP